MPGTVVVSDLSADQFIWTNFTTSGGHYLVCVNGADATQLYDGSNWTEPSIVDDMAADLTGFAYVFAAKTRLFFIENDSANVRYLPVDSISGTAGLLVVGGELSLGGHIVAGAAITNDSGNGPEDYVGFISSEGEVVIYSGTDPGDADAWSLRGVFRVGRPIGRRCLLQIGGDVVALTQDGAVSLVRSILLDRSAQSKAAFTDNIRTAFAQQYALSGTFDGWDIIAWPAGHMAIVNVPIVDGSVYHQYVMNVLTGAWCRFKGINANAWVLARDSLYLALRDGRVMQFGIAGNDDPSGTGGEPINAIAVGAFSQMGAPGVIKHTKAAHAIAKGSGDFTLGVNMATDFRVVETPVGSADFSVEGAGSHWDEAKWDQDRWPTAVDELVDTAWLGVASAGYFIAPVLTASANNDDAVSIQFINMNIIYETGALVG